MLIRERPLLIGVTLDAPGIGSSRQSGLLQLKTTMGIVAIAALDHSLEDFVMEGFVEVWFDFVMTTETKLWFAKLQQLDAREVRLLGICFTHKSDRARQISPAGIRVRRVTIRTTNVVTPVFAATKIVVFLLSRMTSETGFRDFLG
jgi:hypothetical protein